MFDLSDVVEDVSEVSKQGGRGEGGEDVGQVARLVQGCSGCCSYKNQAVQCKCASPHTFNTFPHLGRGEPRDHHEQHCVEAAQDGGQGSAPHAQQHTQPADGRGVRHLRLPRQEVRRGWGVLQTEEEMRLDAKGKGDCSLPSLLCPSFTRLHNLPCLCSLFHPAALIPPYPLFNLLPPPPPPQPHHRKAARSPPAGGNGEQYALLLQDEQDGSHGRRRAQLLRQEQWQEEGQEQGQVSQGQVKRAQRQVS